MSCLCVSRLTKLRDVFSRDRSSAEAWRDRHRYIGCQKTRRFAWAQELIPCTAEFIGGHPLVAIGGTSIREATPDVFRDSIYCLVPLPRTRSSALDGAGGPRSARSVPSPITSMRPNTIATSRRVDICRLPSSIALMHTVGSSGGWREIMPIAGEGLLNMTEFAGGEPEAERRNTGQQCRCARRLDRTVDRLVARTADADARSRGAAELLEKSL